MLGHVAILFVLSAMRQLFLFDNQLTGQIPPSIRNITVLSTGKN